MKRFLLVFRNEFFTGLRRPAFWVLIALLLLMTWGLSNGNVRISSGDASVGGAKAWVTSEFALAQIMTLVVNLFYPFFVVVAAGMVIIQDRDLKIGELLHATPLKVGEYIWGKFLGVLSVFVVVLAVHLLFTVVFMQLIPNADLVEYRGPFSSLNYLRPALVFALPTLLFFAGISFLLGERTRKPILVFIFPVAVIILSAFFLWNWSPTWLDPRWNRLLMLLDPAGFRWLNETWLTVDRGVGFYNNSRIPLDAGFILQRIIVAAIGMGAVVWSQVRFQPSPGDSGRKSKTKAAPEPPETAASSPSSIRDALASLRMSSRLPGFWSSARSVAVNELRELRSQPGLYLFIPLILLQTLGNAFTALGAFGSPLLLVSGNLAVGSMNTLTLLICLLLLFYCVESLQREWSTGISGIYYSTPAPTSAILFGKALANSLVGVTVVLVMLLGCWIAQSIQSMVFGIPVPFEIRPYFLVWGVLLFPTFLVWTAFITMVQAILRNRYTTYAIGLAALITTGYYQFKGDMTWAFNWDLWSAVRWSDMGTFELDRSPLLLNRLLAIALTILFTTLAVRFFGRIDWDGARLIHALHPRRLFRSALRILPYALPVLVLGGVLQYQVSQGFQGSAIEKKQKDYWRKNLATWKDAPIPAMRSLEMDLRLVPGERRFEVQGFYVVHNHLEKPLKDIPVTAGDWDDLKWQLNGRDHQPDDRNNLFIFRLDPPLAPGQEAKLGFQHQGSFPKGITSNGGGSGQFILPSGVVLHTFGPTFLPVLGYIESVGVDEDNRYESKEYPDDFHLEQLAPAFGSPTAYTTEARITIPEEYRVNSVGALVGDEVREGWRTSVWRSDHPVKIFNVVAGRWKVEKGEGTAIFYHPGHPYNIAEMSEALQAARKYYSDWFYPFPWKELKLSEFPNLAGYAQGFGTNITFSEGIGFLTRSEAKTNTAFLVTAHEAAHQWWGNILTPGNGPGGNILSEGMSHFSTLLLIDQVKGTHHRIEFAKRIEERYSDGRQVDSERPMVKIDGTRPGDTTATYDKGGWVFWMLLQHIGRENALAGMQDFIRRFENGPDYPVLQDFVKVMRGYAPDPDSYDAFVQQWFFEVVAPEYQIRDVESSPAATNETVRTVAFVLENKGTGAMPLEVAVVRGERFSDLGEPQPDYREARQTVTLAAGESARLEMRIDFEPQRILVDPDAKVLMLERDKAVHRF